MTRMLRVAIGVLATCVLAACGAGDSFEGAQTNSAALSLPGLTPVPINGDTGKPSWDGSPVELMFADAFASCGYDVYADGGSPFGSPSYEGDAYINYIRARMSASKCSYTDSTTGNRVEHSFPERATGWTEQRNDKNCNADPTTKAKVPVAIARSLLDVTVVNEPPFPTGEGPARLTAGLAKRAITDPVMNICIAQHLRAMSPGASGGEALLLSAADQRQLLALQKERAQMAVLQFAQLGRIMATPELADPTTVSNCCNGGGDPLSGFPYSFIPMLQHWAQTASGERAALLKTLGDEFAAAVQLHVVASGELAQLLARSASARLPVGASASDPAWQNTEHRQSAVETWGPGSWRERLLASTYGGDPLVEDPVSPAWRHFLHQTGPGVIDATWPDSTNAPFVSAEINDPKTSQLLSLATSADALYLKLSSARLTQPASNFKCDSTEPGPSGERLYRATEAYVRTNQCSVFDASTGKCKSFQLSEIPEPATGYESFELWTKYRITPAHARQLAVWLAQMTPRICEDEAGNAKPHAGGLDFKGRIDLAVLEGGQYYHIEDFEPKRRVMRELAGLYTRYSLLRMQDIKPEVDPFDQGYPNGHVFPDPGIEWRPNGYEEQRRAGAVSALVATRDAILGARENLANVPQAIRNFFHRSDSILKVIESAVGRSGLTLSPILDVFDSPVYTDPNGGPSPFYPTLNRRRLRQAFDGVGNARWNVELAIDPEDPFWDLTRSADYRIVAVPFSTVVDALAAYPGSKVFGVDVQGYQADPASVISGAPSIRRPSAVSSSLWRFEIPFRSLPNAEWTLVALRYMDDAARTPVFAPLVSHVVPRSGRGGHYFGFNGSLSNTAARVMAVNMNQPSQPAFDGFGLPASWLPPTDPSLFGGTLGDDAVSAYLRKARASAEEATAAVKEAFEEMLKQQEDEAQLAAAVARGEKVAALERSALCGSEKCDTSVTEVTLDVPGRWNTASPRATWFRVAETIKETDVPRPTLSDLQNKICVVPEGKTWEDLILTLTPQQRLDCLASIILTSAQRPFKVLTAVAKERNAPAAPDFAEYSGGSLQLVAIEQWAALRGLDDRIRSFIATSDAAIGHVDLLENELDRAKEENKEMYNRCGRLDEDLIKESVKQCALGRHKCGPQDVYRGWDELNWEDEVSNSTTESGGLGVSVYLISANGSWGKSSTPMSLGAKRRLCEAYRDKLDSSAWRLTEGLLQAYANVEQRRSEFTEATARIQAAAARGASLRHQTDLAIAKSDLEVELLRTSQKTSFGLYRQLHSYDAWRAKALLESARISAAVARKAIESQYVVNLSSLNGAEPLVASPTSWADEVYEYDLDMPAAVGLAVGDPAPGGLYPNRVLDYVGNLERFVNGYSIARPTTVADGDTEIISLPGPKGLIDGKPPVQTIFPDGGAYAWSYLCQEGTTKTWRTMPPNGRPTDACLPSAARPLRARLLFALDAWGRLHGDVADEPFDRRYNARWKDLAVNLVGVKVLDCNKARDTYGCQQQPFVRYRLSHGDVSWVTDAEQSWSVLPAPTGWIEGGKALAAEQWFDAIENSWSKPFVAAVRRGEFVSRPFGGAYDAEFEVGPELVLENIQRVQVLASSKYWVKQH